MNNAIACLEKAKADFGNAGNGWVGEKRLLQLADRTMRWAIFKPGLTGPRVTTCTRANWLLRIRLVPTRVWTRAPFQQDVSCLCGREGRAWPDGERRSFRC